MQERLDSADVGKMRKRLRGYVRNNLEFNEPHFTLKLQVQKIDRKEVIKNLLRPDNLVFVGISKSRNPQYKYVHDLYFRLSKNRIFKIPVCLKHKSLYLITIFKIRRKVQHEALKYCRK